MRVSWINGTLDRSISGTMGVGTSGDGSDLRITSILVENLPEHVLKVLQDARDVGKQPRGVWLKA